jgi:RNA polymerase sigma factor (sigma-70 family)
VEPDHGEFEQFFTAEYDAVLRSVEAITGNREFAVDATQDGFIRAHLHWETIRNYDAPAAWVRRAAINASRDRERSERRRRGREVAAMAPDDGARTAGHEDRLESAESARAFLDPLAARQREVASMYYIDDRSLDDIAETLGLSIGTVKSHLADARLRLRQLHPR